MSGARYGIVLVVLVVIAVQGVTAVLGAPCCQSYAATNALFPIQPAVSTNYYWPSAATSASAYNTFPTFAGAPQFFAPSTNTFPLPYNSYLTSVGTLGGSCQDTSSQCSSWAAAGQCFSNMAIMSTACPLSCGTCLTRTSSLGAGLYGAGYNSPATLAAIRQLGYADFDDYLERGLLNNRAAIRPFRVVAFDKKSVAPQQKESIPPPTIGKSVVNDVIFTRLMHSSDSSSNNNNNDDDVLVKKKRAMTVF